MTERPILFSGGMVRAILSGTKTQTRRVVKPRTTAEGFWADCVARYDLSSEHLESFELQGCDVQEHGDGTFTIIPPCPYGQVGDRLWVRETWQYYDWADDGYPTIRYASDNGINSRIDYPEEWSERVESIWAQLSEDENFSIDGRARDRRWRSSRFMPRWASRITLEITDVRVQRLHEISDADALDEGVPYPNVITGAIGRFRDLWDSINAKRAPWASNPFVWAITFRRL